MNEVEGFYKWAVGVVIAIFTAIFGTHRHMQGQLDKHKAETEERLENLTCIKQEEYKKDQRQHKEDQQRLEDHLKDLGRIIEKNSTALFKEIKSINDKIFSHVSHHEDNHNNHG